MPKILIVEDEEYLAEMYKIKFEHSGYEVVIANDGPEGFMSAKTEQPDLILLDLVLPGMDGLEVLHSLRNNSETKGLKVFILSNLGQGDEVKLVNKTGADGYFIKADLTPGQLVEKVNLVLNHQPEAKADGRGQAVSLAEPRSAAAKSAKILLIEDEEAIISMYQLRFKKSGFEIEVAKNGAWGLKMARQKKYDVILLDMVMPAMSGYDALEILKADENCKNVPVIILSNSAQDKDIVKAKKLGAAACLLKSAITPARLVREVEKFLSEKDNN